MTQLGSGPSGQGQRWFSLANSRPSNDQQRHLYMEILPISRVSTVEISRPQPCLALHYRCDPEYTIELECQYSCLSASWTASPSNQVTGTRITPGPERCSVCYPAMPSRLTGMPGRMTATTGIQVGQACRAWRSSTTTLWAVWALQNVSIIRLVEPLGIGYGSCARQVGTLAGAGKSG